MRLAVREHLLPGVTTEARLTFAQSIGLDGVHFSADGLYQRTGDMSSALKAHGLAAAGVHVGGTHLLHPEINIRDQAIKHFQRAMTSALDLDTLGVTFYSHAADTPTLPDLHPYKSNIELEAEFLVMQLKATLADFAYATGAELYLAPRPRTHTHLLHRLEMVATVLRHNGNHPNVKIAADTGCMAQEETDITQALRDHVDKLGVVYLQEADGGLPADGLDYDAIITTLRDGGYTGWLVMDGQGDDDSLRAATDRIKKAIG